MTDSEKLTGHLSDRLEKCRAEDMMTCTRFLDASEKSEALRFCSERKANAVFFGGYPDAERTVCVFVPEYWERNMFPSYFYENEDDAPLCAIRCEYSKDSPPLSHRDFLGALMALGIKRETLGDILVSECSADVFVTPEICPFLLNEFTKAARTELKTRKIRLSDVILPKKNAVTLRDTVTSLRLDGIVASLFSLSRSKAEEAISEGIVYVNDVKTLKADARVTEGDKIVLRGCGKAVLTSVGGQSKKGRTVIIFDKYI